MTSAEARTLDATLREFGSEVSDCLRMAREAGLPTTNIVETFFGAAITLALWEGLDAFTVGQLFREAGMQARKAVEAQRAEEAR